VITSVKERGIIFSGEEVRAILAGRKIQARRPVPRQARPVNEIDGWTMGQEPGDVGIFAGELCRLMVSHGRDKAAAGELTPVKIKCPCQPGDLLYVRETLQRTTERPGDWHPNTIPYYRYAADNALVIRDGRYVQYDFRKKIIPSATMPKWASRIWLEIVSVRAERIQAITVADVLAEGYRDEIPHGFMTGQELQIHRRDLFVNSLNAKHPGSWDRNDWVFVLEFKRVERK